MLTQNYKSMCETQARDAKLQARVRGHSWVKHYLKSKKKNKKSRGLLCLFVQTSPLNWQGKCLIEKNLFKEVGLEHETAILWTGSNLPKTVIFKFKKNPFVTEKLPQEWKSIKIMDKGYYRIYDKTLKKLLLPILKKQQILQFYNKTPKVAKIKITKKR